MTEAQPQRTLVWLAAALVLGAMLTGFVANHYLGLTLFLVPDCSPVTGRCRPSWRPFRSSLSGPVTSWVDSRWTLGCPAGSGPEVSVDSAYEPLSSRRCVSWL